MYENMHNQQNNQPLNRLLEAWQTLPKQLKVIWGILGGALILTVLKGVKDIVKSYKHDSNSSKPLNRGQTAPSEPFTSTVDEPLNNEITEDEIQQELIRMTMSELGKRSGEARRRKALE